VHEALVRSGRVGRREDVVRARGFAQVDASHHYVFHGCAGIGEYGIRIGFGSRQAREYAAAGRVLECCPGAEAMLLDGSMCVSTLAIIEPLFTDPALRPRDERGESTPNEAILAWARVRPDRDLRRYVHRRREEARVGGQTVARTLHLSSRGADDLDRTQVLVSRTERRAVSLSEAAERAFRHFVEKQDLLEKRPRRRRMAPMHARPDGSRLSRAVANEVRRALMAKHGDACAIRHCENRIWLENAHHVPHARGGGNELPDQDRLCTLHHRMKDHGEIRWVPDATWPGGGRYETAEGVALPLKPVESNGEASKGPGPPDRVRERGPPLVPSRRWLASNGMTSVTASRRRRGCATCTRQGWNGTGGRDRPAARVRAPLARPWNP
jgi:hypothetical protein